MLSRANRQAAAEALAAAAASGRPIEPLTATYPGFDLDDAYAVQSAIIAARQAAGARRVGWKIGLTSEPMQRMLGVDQPDFSPLLDDTQVEDGDVLDVGALISPRIEGELAFRLSSDFRGPDLSLASVEAAVEAVIPSIEVIDSRIADWRITLPDTVADLASFGRFALGSVVTPIDGLDLPEIELVLTADEAEVDRGRGSAVLGHPLRAVAWLANTLPRFGESLRAGDIVMAGAMHAAVAVEEVSGTRVRASFSSALGSVSLGIPMA